MSRIIITVPDVENQGDTHVHYVEEVLHEMQQGYSSGHVDREHHWASDDEASGGRIPNLVHQARNILWAAENGGTAGRPIDVRTILAAICDESERLYGAS
jgi:hypothetical protein